MRRRASGLRNADGVELHTLVLNLAEGGASVQVTAVVALDEADLDLVVEGAEVPVAVLGESARVVAVDLVAARTEHDTGAT